MPDPNLKQPPTEEERKPPKDTPDHRLPENS